MATDKEETTAAPAGATEKKPAKKSANKKVKTAVNWNAPLPFPYAVLRTGSKQYCVAKGDQLLVEKLSLDPGAPWIAEEILLIAQGPGKITVGKPTVAGAQVKCEVLQQTLDDKILIRHSRRRQSSQKTLGHRQPLTRLVVTEIIGA